MSLPETSIRRPVGAIVLSLLMVLFGIVGFRTLGVREYPAVDPPVVTVTTNYVGASPEVIDSQITEPLEQVINGISGIRVISSTSREQQSSIRIEFTLDSDLEAAANDVRDKVSQAVRRLPADADPPVVEKADADSEAIVFMTVKSDRHSILEISHLADTVIKERVQTIPGVSSVRIFGEKRRAMRLWMDAGKMSREGVTPSDITRAMDAQNVDLPSGRIEGATTEIAVQTDARLSTPAEFERMILRREDGRTLVFGDVGRAELGPENLRTSLMEAGQPLIGVAVIPQPNANAIAIADEFYKRIDVIREQLPEGYTIDIGYDFTRFVRKSVNEVQETLLIAFALVALIIFLFLRDLRSTIIPVIAIPVSITASFFLMYIAGFSINILTLVGVVLSIGLVCDDAIVVLENIYTKVEGGMEPMEAAYAGSKEIYFAVISTTATLAAVFLPIIFLQGLTGRLFREFGVVVVGSVIFSSVVALTLSPMMCSRLLRRNDKPNLFYRLTEPLFVGMTNAYALSLKGYMRVRLITWPLMAGIVYFIVYVVGQLPSELAPLEDRSNIRINVRAPEGATFEYTEHELSKVGMYAQDNIPELSRGFSITGLGGGAPNTGLQILYLQEPEERVRSQEEVFQQLSRELNDVTALRGFPSQPPTIGSRRGGQPLQFVIQAPNMEALKEVLPKILGEASKSELLKFVDADLKINRPEMVVRIDRERAAELGVSVREIARALQLGLGGQRFGYFIMEGKQYQVIGQLERADRNDPGDIMRVEVPGKAGMVPLERVVRFEERAGPAAIYRHNRYVSATISGGTAPGVTLGQAIAEMERISAEQLPKGMQTDLAGQSRDFADSASSLLFAFVLALVLIYLVLAAQFESFRDPMIILLTVPMSVAGALGSLWWTGQTLNVFSQIGIIMLIGLVTKNGILIVEFANQKKEHGLSPLEAAQEAAVSRFRPILMTSLSTILGIMPIALQLGGSAGSRQSLGIAVVGGLLFSGFLTLYMVPAIYAALSARTAHAAPLPEAAPVDGQP
jgi:multidrug efflux pump